MNYWTVITGVVTKETDKAVLLDCYGVEAWIPKSQIKDCPEYFDEWDELELEIPVWLAQEKNLEP